MSSYRKIRSSAQLHFWLPSRAVSVPYQPPDISLSRWRCPRHHRSSPHQRQETDIRTPTTSKGWSKCEAHRRGAALTRLPSAARLAVIPQTLNSRTEEAGAEVETLGLLHQDWQQSSCLPAHSRVRVRRYRQRG